MIKTTVTSWSFPHLRIDEIVGLAKVLDLGGVDIGYFYAGTIDREAVLREPKEYAAKLADYEIEFPCLYHLFGSDLVDRNVSIPEVADANVADFEKVVEFCVAAKVPQIFILPGVVMPGMSLDQALQNSARALRPLVNLAQDAGVIVSVEPHCQGILESPKLVQTLVDEVPGLGVTLDYSHLVCLGYTQAEIDTLIPLATHVHLRQARPGRLQEKLEFGTINFNALLGNLTKAGYDGYVAYEYVHQEYMNTWSDDVLSETIKMRNLVQAFLGAEAA